MPACSVKGSPVRRGRSPIGSPLPRPRCGWGLIGGDFRAHPVGYFIENILKYLDARQIELFIYSNNPYDDAISEALAGLIPNWRNVHGVSVKKVVDYIRDENLHILIDLAGHTGYNRLDVFPYRPAPVQVTWLGYPSTTGVAAMDWIIADPTGVRKQTAGTSPRRSGTCRTPACASRHRVRS